MKDIPNFEKMTVYYIMSWTRISDCAAGKVLCIWNHVVLSPQRHKYMALKTYVLN